MVTIQNILISQSAEVLSLPQATGDSWRLKDMETGFLYYISEGCTLKLLQDVQK